MVVKSQHRPASTTAISNVLFSEGEEFVGNDSTPVINNNSTVQDVTSLTTANNCYNIVFCNEFHEFENYVPTAVNLGDLTHDVACEADERVTMVPENIVASLQTESEVLDDQAVEMAADQPVEMASANCVLVHVVSNGNTQVYPIMASVVHADGTVEYTVHFQSLMRRACCLMITVLTLHKMQVILAKVHCKCVQ